LATMLWPDNGGIMPGKKDLYTPVDPISPPPKPTVSGGLGGRRRVPPPGPGGLLRCPFIAIVSLRRQA